LRFGTSAGGLNARVSPIETSIPPSAAVGAFLAAAGSEPLIAPFPAPDDMPGARFVESDEAALEVLHDLLDALARRREEIAEIATRC
jgi:hypothetical protein